MNNKNMSAQGGSASGGKKHMPGFVPVKFHKSGKLLIFLAAGLVVVGVAAHIYPLVVFGLALGLVSLYLIFVAPKN
jgi:hypothetical protein